MAAHVTCPHPGCGQPVPVPQPETLCCPACRRTFALSGPANSPAATLTHLPDSAPASPSPAPTPAAIPTELPARIGRFEIRDRIGEGTFGVVYLAFDPATKRKIALKVARPEALRTPERIKRFLREGEAAAQLLHSNVVPLFDSGRDGPHYYLAYAFVAGRSLAESLEQSQGRGLDCRQAATLVRHLAEALEYAHQRGITHRDVKPGNVMIDDKGQPLLTDFGLAAWEDSGAEKITQEVVKGMGTAAYMAPEQAAGQAIFASDQYSLGCTFYELLTGRTLFTGPPELQLVLHQTQEARSPRVHNKEVPRDLETICLKCLEKDPTKRYPDCLALAEDLRRWLAGEPIAARRIGVLERTARWAKRQPAMAGLVLAVVVLATVGGTAVTWQWRTAVTALERAEQEQKRRALGQVQALQDAAAGAVPSILADLHRQQAEVLPRLRQLWNDKSIAHPKRMRVALTLMAAEPETVREDLLGWMLRAEDPAEVLLAREALQPVKAELAELLWSKVEAKDAVERFRALVALARFDPQSPRWEKAARPCVEHLVKANPLQVGVWSPGLQDVSKHLLGPLEEVFRDRGRVAERQVACSVLGDYAAEQVEVLVRLLAAADTEQFAALLPRVRNHGERAIGLLKEQARPLKADWRDPPLQPGWSAPEPALVQEIEKADGLILERFALVQSLPLPKLQPLIESLARSGYRPVRCRPYQAGAQVRVAALWTRDGLEYQLVQGMAAEEIRRRDEELRRQGFQPADVAGYLQDGLVHFAALWSKPEAPARETRLYAGVTEQRHRWDGYGPLEEKNFARLTIQAVRRPDHQLLYSAVMVQATPDPQVPGEFQWPEKDYLAKHHEGWACMDVSIFPAGVPEADSRQRAANNRAKAEAQLLLNAGDLDACFRRARACYDLGEDATALADLNRLIQARPDHINYRQTRAFLYARRGHGEQARADLEALRQTKPDAATEIIATCIVELSLGEGKKAVRGLDEVLRARPGVAFILYNAACAHGLAARAARTQGHQQQTLAALAILGQPALPAASTLGLLHEIRSQQEARSRRHAETGLAYLKRALEAGYANLVFLQGDCDLDFLRELPEFDKLLWSHSRVSYAGIWYQLADREGQEIHGLGLGGNLERCRQLAAAGYRPSGLSVAWLPGELEPRAAMVWQRPRIGEVELVARASRQANAAVALLRLGQEEPAWPLLKHTPTPDARTCLQLRLGPLGVDPAALAGRLNVEKDSSIRQALILGLGEYTGEQVTAELRHKLTIKLLDWYRHDPDPGIHAAAGWLLGHGKEGPVLRPLDWGQRQALAAIDQELSRKAPVPPQGRRWWLNGQGQTMILFPGPIDFLQGTPLNQPGHFPYGELLHRRHIERGFALASTEVTVAQFQRFSKEHPELNHSYLKLYASEPDCPMGYVTWYQAAEYCRWLSEQEGIPEEQMVYPPIAVMEKSRGELTPLKLPANHLARTGYRLPTEAEWEYACRAEAATAWSHGGREEEVGYYAWLFHNSQDRSWPVGQKRPNVFGLFDLHGNLWEWCQNSIVWDPVIGPKGFAEDREDNRDITDASNRVMRGADFMTRAVYARSAHRHFQRPGYSAVTVGLRPARTCYP